MEDCNLTNIAAYLPRMARLQPHVPAVFCPQTRDRRGRPAHTHYTYAQLDRESNRIAHGLAAMGIGRGVRTVLMVPPSLDFFALTFALFKVGTIPVLIDPGMGIKNLKVCLEEAAPQAFIGIPKAHLARVVLGWGKHTIRSLVTVGPRLGWGGKSLAELGSEESDYPIVPPQKDEIAAILFTSGSTGPPKGAVYHHGNFCAQVETLRRLYDIRPGEIDLPTFPLFALFAPALGMTSVIPEMDFTRPASVDPRKIIAAVESFGVVSMFGSPALINRVGRYGKTNAVRLPTLHRIISAGAPVPAVVLECFCTMLNDDVEIFTPYGATEALPVCSIGSKEILQETRQLTDMGQGVCVGRPVPDIEVKIIRISDAPIASWTEELCLADGSIGEIAVKGLQVTAEYYQRPEATNLAKIQDPTGGFYHRMGDLGYRDEQGRIWFCGRKSHRVVTGETTLFTIPCEAIFNTHPQVFRTALVGLGPRGTQRPVICIELESGVSRGEQPRIKQELLEIGAQYEITAGIGELLFHPGFPVDIRHNAKIFREKLAVWAERRIK